MLMMMILLPKVFVADNDDTGGEVAANSDDQENAESQQGDH